MLLTTFTVATGTAILPQCSGASLPCSPDDLWRVWVIDVDGLRIILLTSEFAATPAEVRRELAEIVGSIRFVPRP